MEVTEVRVAEGADVLASETLLASLAVVVAPNENPVLVAS